MRMRLPLALVAFTLTLSVLFPNDFQFYPDASYDPKIPTLRQVIGHDWGEEITDYEQMRRYIRALEQASRRVRVVEYGKTWEGRSLYYLVLGSEKNLARLDTIKAGQRKLAHPRGLTESEATNLIQRLPSIVWLAYSVHGNETSGPEAALLTAYHLLAARNDALADLIASETLVIIDPLQNPDGRQRFIAHYRQNRGRWPDENPLAAEHLEDWPGGRTNHYLFDMNRDWFALTQTETRARVAAFLQWYPHVFVDLHEMGSDSTYYFAPPAPPINPHLSPGQSEWHAVFGKNNASWFDRLHIDYFTREVFDSFYPGYGEGWPMFHGAVGMTYEQAGVRGLAVKRTDQTVLRFRDAVRHHFLASLATAETTARNREGLLRHFYETRKAGLRNQPSDGVSGYVFDPSRDPARAAKLARVLLAQGIEVHSIKNSVKLQVREQTTDQPEERTFPAGSYFVSLAQPARALAVTLLSRGTALDEDFLKEQQRRYEKRLRDQFYDVTAWSLPLLYNVPCFTTDQIPGDVLAPLNDLPTRAGEVKGGEAKLAYLIPWGTNAAVHALSKLLSSGVRVHSADKEFCQNGRCFPAGSLIVKVRDNPADLYQRLQEIARQSGADVYSTHTAWVEEGINFGSSQVRFVKRPRVALAYNEPTLGSSAGALRYLIEQVYEYPATVIPTRFLRGANLNDFDVLILPDARSSSPGYRDVLGETGAQTLKQWISQGGTLITIGEATTWLTEDKVALLATSREYRNPEEDRPVGRADKRFDFERAIRPQKELPARVPGALVRVYLDTEHWLAFGYHSDANVLVTNRNIFTPLKLDKGRNVGVFRTADRLLISGFIWPDTRDQLAEKAYLMHQALGAGHVVAFSEDPAYRAFCDGLDILLFNAIFFGPAH